MNIIEYFSQAIESLKLNKNRSILTMIGIVMGMFSVITIITLGNAMKYYIEKEFNNMGVNSISISYKANEVRQREWLVLEDLEYIKKLMPEIKNVGAIAQQTGILKMEVEDKDTIIFGASSQYKSVAGIDMLSGRYINSFDVLARNKVVVVDETFAKKYFNTTDVLGKAITYKSLNGNSLKLEIVGVIKGDDDFFDSMLSSDIFPVLIHTPITTLQDFYFNYQKLDSITITFEENTDELVRIGKTVVKYLEMHKGYENIYIARNPLDNIEVFTTIINMISGVLLSISIITLLVGGIGIINIMLVSVTERIREIGIRKALGARENDITLQFLIESIILTSFSGLIGIILGVLAGMGISILLKIPPSIDIKTVLLSFLGVIILGLVFGVYPAKKAATLEPVESLRYE